MKLNFLEKMNIAKMSLKGISVTKFRENNFVENKMRDCILPYLRAKLDISISHGLGLGSLTQLSFTYHTAGTLFPKLCDLDRDHEVGGGFPIQNSSGSVTCLPGGLHVP